jgi:hypothetical protein
MLTSINDGNTAFFKAANHSFGSANKSCPSALTIALTLE